MLNCTKITCMHEIQSAPFIIAQPPCMCTPVCDYFTFLILVKAKLISFCIISFVLCSIVAILDN